MSATTNTATTLGPDLKQTYGKKKPKKYSKIKALLQIK